MEKETVHSVCIEDGGERLDKALARLVPGLSRARIQTLIADGFVAVEGRGAKYFAALRCPRASSPFADKSILQGNSPAPARQCTGRLPCAPS